MMSLLTALATLLAISSAAPTYSQYTVRAPTGYYTGAPDTNFSNVRAFLSVPYGQDTSGSNRWLPPQSVPLSSNAFNVTAMPPACPQYVSAVPAIWNQQIPQYLQVWGNANNSAGESAIFTTEDCLKLAIWTPHNATSSSHLPVAMFWTGGGLQTNGVDVPIQLPAGWVNRTQSHIVVTINYRMNIMGFPNAAGLYDQNLGLMDQRLALEWVSGSALHTAPWADNSNFTFVAQNVGCNHPTNASAELECMRGVPYAKIINFMGQYQDNSTLRAPMQPAISFGAVPDERLVFENVTERYEMGFVTKVPMIYSSVANEGGSLQRYPVNDPYNGTNQTAANAITTGFALCPAADTTKLRHSIGLPTYRYQYAGNWTNQDPLPWMGAFHSSDLAMLMGSYPDGNGRPCCEPLEVETANAMQDYVYSFMVDPWDGPPSMGWYPMDPTAADWGQMLRFGAGGKAVQNVTGFDVEAVCYGQGTYNPFP
ncbi:hypothetical protein LTR12_011779 [Friedmanniomyces endolithicus]|nr:hypothetical protein LTR12_011779 [Friedmanniomyces endolithicus]